MFWLDNLNELFKPILIPDATMTLDDKLNAIIRFIIFIGIIATLIFNDTRYVLFVIIIMILTIFMYNYQSEKNKKIEKYLDTNDLDIVNNKKCIKPTQSNPFMNPNILSIKEGNENYQACSINTDRIKKSMNSYFNEKVFRDTNDIYDKASSERQFYTVASTTIPNHREHLGEWLYDRGPSCKENNLKCYNNIYNDIKNS